MVTGYTAVKLPESETFTVQDLLAMQEYKAGYEPPISYAQRDLLKYKLRGEYTTAGGVCRGLQQVTLNILNLLNTLVFAPASALAWLAHVLSRPGDDIVYGRKRIARMRPDAGIKNLRRSFKNSPEIS